MRAATPGPDVHPRARLLHPPRSPRAYALYAARLPAGMAVSRLPEALAAHGFAVLTLDLGASPPDRDAAVEDSDVAALRRAAQQLPAQRPGPALLIGHSWAGPATLAAARALGDVRALVTVGSPAPQRPRLRGVPLLVLHAPLDPVVPIDDAVGVFTAARHPGSFIALDGVDHAITDERQARHVAALITAWAQPYLPDLHPNEATEEATDEATDDVVVTEAGTGRYTQRITAGRHVLTADEPTSIGGHDTGPNPYDLLLAALGACTSMTLRMYADRKGLPLQRTTVRLRHDHVHAKDCANVEQNTGTISRIVRELDLEGPLTDEHRRRLVEIADRCPVHRTISSEIAFETTA